MFIGFLKFLWRHVPFLIILGIASYLFYLAYGAKTSWGISILLGFIGAFVFGYLTDFIEELSDQMLVLLLILVGLIIFLLFKYLVVPFILDKDPEFMWLEIGGRVFVFVVGTGLGGPLGNFVRYPFGNYPW